MNILVLLPVTDDDKSNFASTAPHGDIRYSDATAVTKDDVSWADIAIGNIPRNLLPYAKNLQWQQLNSAGSDGYTGGALPAGCILTNSQ